MNRWAVVIPTIRPEKCRDFIEAWLPLFKQHNVHLVIVEDAAKRSPLVTDGLLPYTHMCWDDLPDYMPRRTDMIRSWGFYYVWKNNLADYVLTLDDDTVPHGDPFAAYELAFTFGSVYSPYLSVGALTSSGLEMRGFPYKDRKRADVAVQYGGWSGVLDYDAATQLALPQGKHEFYDIVMPVPKGTAATCCIMNTAFAVEYTPITWQLTMLDGRYNRVGDIWSGLFIKKTLDAIGKVMIINGKAKVIHDRASDPYNSLVKEAPSVWMNENLWENLPSPTTGDMITVFREVTTAAAKFFAQYDVEFADKFIQDRDKWLSLFDAS